LQLHKTQDPEEFHRDWEEARDELGKRMTVGGNFYPNIRKDVEAMQGIWNGG
jgi:hypothetical protein